MAKVNTEPEQEQEQAEDDNEKTMVAEFGMPSEATISSSKRKRSQPGLVYAAYVSAQSEPDQERAHTPKRSRTRNWPVSERGGSSGRGDGPDIKQRSVRRKNGKYGLSSLSRRHAQESADSAERASKFLEGSMNDRPSAMPPSLFTRDMSEHSLAASAYSANVDHLMADYHNGDNDQTPRQSVEAQYPHASLELPMSQAYSALEKLSVESPDHTKPSGLFRFGRMVASSFNPANVWGSFSRTFKDTKDEMTLRNIEENRKKAILDQQKAEAEAKYAEMKAAGLFARSPFTVLHTGQPEAKQPDQGDLPPLQHLLHAGQSSFTPVASDEDRDHYFAPQPQPSAAMDQEEEEEDDGDILRPVPQYSAATTTTDQRRSNDAHGHAPDPQKTLKSRKSLFSIIHRPSFSTLKRPRSDFDLIANLSTTDTTSARPNSASVSPDKRDKAQQHNEVSTLKHSMSKRDLGKQQKLSKRVSDLESKLAEARRELTSAINNASPLPDLPSRFEKFTPSKHTPTGSITARFRSKFIPGKLPSLPSERLLFPGQPAPTQSTESHLDDITNIATPAPAPRFSLNLNQDPPLPSLPDTMTEPSTAANQKPLPEPPIIEEESFVEADMQESNDIVHDDDDTIYVAHAKESYEDLDAQLKAVEQRAADGKTRRRSGAKKRKSTDDMEYRPGSREDDDDDYEESPANRKFKKRKSLSTKSSKDGSLAANPGKKKTSGKKSSTNGVAATAQPNATPNNETNDVLTGASQPSPTVTQQVIDLVSNDLEISPSSRPLGVDSQAGALEPIFEEDSFSSTKHDSGITTITETKITAEIKHLHSSSRSTLNQHRLPGPRSNSPSKGKRVGSPPPTNYSEVEGLVEEIVRVTPGKGDVPEMPKNGLTGGHKGHEKGDISQQAGATRENFEWPEDVF